MAEPRNPYLDLMEDDNIKPVAKPAQTVGVTTAPLVQDVNKSDAESARLKRQNETQSTNPYDILMGDEDRVSKIDPTISPISNAVINNALGLMKIAPYQAEKFARAPIGSVEQVKALMTPKKAMTPEAAARALMESKKPQFVPQGGGQAWLNNWANIQDPEFTGGVPEAAQKYQRGKPGGDPRVSPMAKLYKKFGNRPLNIQGQMVEAQIAAKAAIEAEKAAAAQAAEVERQIQATANATKYAKHLGTLYKGYAGFGAGLGGYDVYNRLNEKDTHGAIASGLGTAASLAPMAVGSAGVLPAVGAAMPFYLMAHDRIERLKQHPEEIRLQEDQFDPMGNPLR